MHLLQSEPKIPKYDTSKISKYLPSCKILSCFLFLNPDLSLVMKKFQFDQKKKKLHLFENNDQVL